MDVATLTNIACEIEHRGFATIEGVLAPKQVAFLIKTLESLGDDEAIRKRGGIFAIRNLLELSPEIGDLAKSIAVRELVEPILGPDFWPVRGILFDKIPDANWKVPWHQDVTIAVQERVETEGFGPWTMKADVLHVQPPTAVLENMLSVRLHLDACGPENGALHVIPGSHLSGRIPEERIPDIRKLQPDVVCTVDAGGALLMRPLLLHASSPSTIPAHRRVIHIDFASLALPNGMRWYAEKQSA